MDSLGDNPSSPAPETDDAVRNSPIKNELEELELSINEGGRQITILQKILDPMFRPISDEPTTGITESDPNSSAMTNRVRILRERVNMNNREVVIMIERLEL